MSQAVFSANPLGALGDYISEPTKRSAVSQSSDQPESSELVSDSELARECIWDCGNESQCKQRAVVCQSACVEHQVSVEASSVAQAMQPRSV
jgi:hypothetical protein